MDTQRLAALLDDARASRPSQRELLKRGAALGLSAPALALLSAVSGPAGRATAQGTPPAGAANPFGVDPS